MQKPDKPTTQFSEVAKHRSRYAIIFIAVVFAYGLELSWYLASFKGPFEYDKAWQKIAQFTLDYQYKGVPEMKIGSARVTYGSCSLWNFEVIWGACATVRITLLVRDLLPEHHHLVWDEAAHLARQMQTPCSLLHQLGMENDKELIYNFGCNGWLKDFTLSLPVYNVTVDGAKDQSGSHNTWLLNTSKYLYTYGPITGRH